MLIWIDIGHYFLTSFARPLPFCLFLVETGQTPVALTLAAILPDAAASPRFSTRGPSEASRPVSLRTKTEMRNLVKEIKSGKSVAGVITVDD
jgi:hypothetical protein